MTEDKPQDGDDAWTIPLHGASVPFAPSADVPVSGQPFSQEPPPLEEGDLRLLSSDNDMPTLGYHPRLRRFGEAA